MFRRISSSASESWKWEKIFRHDEEISDFMSAKYYLPPCCTHKHSKSLYDKKTHRE